jgi:ParB family chromosome partitioning protein
MSKHDIIEIEVEKLKPNPWNPNKMSKYAEKSLEESLRHGIKQTLLVRPLGDGYYEIIDGEHRFKKAKELGIKTLPCIVLNEDDVDAKLDTLALNKIHGIPDPIKLFGLITSLQQKHKIQLEDICTRTGYTVPEFTIAKLRSEGVIKPSKEKVESNIEQLVILATKDELNIIEQALETHRGFTGRAYRRNGSILAEICKKAYGDQVQGVAENES